MSFLADKLKLEVKSGSRSRLARFASVQKDAVIHIVPQDEPRYTGVLGSSSQSLSDTQSNIDAYFAMISDNINTKIVSFDSNSINFGNDTLLRGNLVVLGTVYTVASDVLTEENTFVLNNYGASAQQGVNSVSERALIYLDAVVLSTSNVLAEKTLRDFENLKLVLDIDGINSLLNNNFTLADFNQLFASRTLDDIQQGTSNRYITNNEYTTRNPGSSFIVSGNLTNSNILADNIYANNNIYTKIFYGDGSGITNVNSTFFNTNTIVETADSSNLYFTAKRAGIIAEASNMDVSNYILDANSYFMHLLQEQDANTSNFIADTSNHFIANEIQQAADFNNFLSRYANAVVIKIDANALDKYLYFEESSNNVSVYYETTVAHASNYILSTSNDISTYLYMQDVAVNEYMQLTSNNIYVDLAAMYQRQYELCINTSNYTEAVLHTSNVDISNLIADVENILAHYLQQSNLHTSQHILYTNDTSYAHIEDSRIYTANYLQTQSNYVIDMTMQSFTTVNDTLQINSNVTIMYLNENIANLSNYILFNSNDLAYKIATEPPMNIITYQHLMHFKFLSSALLKDETNSYNLTNYGGLYAASDNNNSIYLAAGHLAKIPNVNWSLFTDLTIAGWFKSAGLADGDSLFEFAYLDIVSDQLKAWYNFESNLNDSTANNYTLISGIGVDAPTYNIVVKRLGESSIEYTGLSQYLQSSDINLSNRSFSVSFWLYLKDATNTSDWWIMSQGLPGVRQLFHIAFINRTFKFGFWNDDLFTGVLDLNNVNNTWKHMVFVYDKEDNRSMKIYIDNVLVASKNAGGDTQFDANTFRIGKGIATGNGFLGNLDDVKVYYKALSANEIQRLYDINAQLKNIKVLHRVTEVSFVIDEVSVYSVAYVPETWNHLIWNVVSSVGGQGYVKINNGAKHFFNEVQLTSGSYINTLGNGSGDLYVSDFRVLTIPMTTAIETEIYSPASTEDVINNYEDINIAVADTTRHIQNSWKYLNEFSNYSFVSASNIIRDNSNAITDTINVFMATQASDKETLIASLSSTLNNSVSALTTDDIPETANHIYYSDARFLSSLNTRTIDEIPRNIGGSNSVIIDNLYDSNLFVYGNLTAYNVELFGAGGSATFNTSVYNDERIEVFNYSNYEAVKVQHYVSTLADTITLANDDANVFTLRNDGKLGVKKAVSGSDTLDVSGSVRADYFSGSGEGLVNINLSMKTTADLAETVGGSNLYFRNARVSSILAGSNVDTSNYVANESNVIFQRMRVVDINISNLIANVSNILIASTESIGSNFVAMTSNSLFAYIISEGTNQSNNVWNMSNYVFGNFSNLYIFTNQSNFMMGTSNLIQGTINYSNYVMSNFVVISSNLNELNRQGCVINQSNYMSDTSNLIGTRIWTVSRDHSNLIMGFSNLFGASLSYGGFNNLSNYIEATSNLLSTTWNNMYAASSNYMNQESTKILNYTSATINELSSTYGVGDTVKYSHTFDSNIVSINFRDKKILNGVSSDVWMITSNTCNYTSIYPVMNNFTMLNDMPNYLLANEYAFRSTSNVFLNVNNQFEIMKLMGSLDGKTFGIHFVFSTLRTQNTPIYYLGNARKVYLSIKISYGYLYFIIGNGAGESTLSFYASTTIILPNTWYTVDFAFETRRAVSGGDGNVGVQVLINLLPQMINFTNIVKPYDTRYYYQGAVYTNTYYSSNSWVSGGLCPIMRNCAYDYGSYSNLIFSSYFASNYDYQYSSNVSGTNVLNAGFYDFADVNRLVIGDRSVADLNFVFTEVETNVKLQTGYYYFMLDLQNEITADLLIGNYTHNGIDEYMNVANYYNSNFLLGGVPSADINATSNQVMTNPVYIPVDGYYRFYLRMFRHINDRHKKYFLPKYYYTPVWSGSSYTFETLKSNITYISYNTLNSSVMNNKVDFNQLYYVNNTVTGATSNLYVYRYFNKYIYGVGANDIGQLGIGNNTHPYKTITKVLDTSGLANSSLSGASITAIYSGDIVTFFKKTDNTILGCGDKNLLGLGYNLNPYWQGFPISLSITNVKQVAAGNNHVILLKDDKTVYSIGYNYYGQLGLGIISFSGNNYREISFRQVKINSSTYMTDIDFVAAGADVSFFINSTDRTVYACGVNNMGQLGINSIIDTNSGSTARFPQLMKDPTGMNNISGIIHISAYASSTMLTSNSGHVFGCGYNGGYNLGLGNNTYTVLVPTLVPITDVKKTAASYSHTLFLKNDNTVYACGVNSSGECGIGTKTSYVTTITQVKDINGVNGTGITGITDISVMQSASLFLHSKNILYFCGYSGYINSEPSNPTLTPIMYNGDILNITLIPDNTYKNILFKANIPTTTNVSNYNYTIPHSNIVDSFFSGLTSNSVTDTSDVVQNQKYTSNFAYQYSSNTSLYLGAYSSNDGSFYDYRPYTQGAVYTNTYYSTNPWTIPAPAPITRTTANGYTSFSNLIFSSYYASNFDYQYSMGISSADVVNNAYFDNADTRLTIGDRGISHLNFVLTEVEANVRLNTGYYYFMLDLQNEVTTDLLIGKNTDRNLDEYANVANYYGDLLNNPSANITHPKNMTTMYPIHIPEGYYRFYLRMFRTIANRNNKYFIPKYYYTSTWTSQSYSLNSSNEMAYMPYNILPPAYQTGSVNFNNLYFVNNTVTGATSDLYVYRYFNKGAYACGYNNLGQLGIGSSVTPKPILVPVLANDGTQMLGITQVSPSDYHSLFLKNDGTVYACGFNYYGQFGIGSTSQYNPTLVLLPISGIIQVSAGYQSSFFLKGIDGALTGTVYACGFNSSGQLGIGSTSHQTTLVSVKDTSGNNISGIKQISSFSEHTLFLHNSGTVYACGYNYYGQLGIGSVVTPKTVLVPVLANDGTQLLGITQVSAGQDYSLFLNGVNGTVYACGNNNYGQFGIGTTSQINTLLVLLSVSGITQVSAGYYHSLFLKGVDGVLRNTVYACGYNNEGQLGIGSTSTRETTLVSVRDTSGNINTKISGITQIAAGMSCSVFLKETDGSLAGTVYACGLNSQGQLGINSISSYETKLVAVKDTTGNEGTKISGITQITRSLGQHLLFVRNVPVLVNVSNNNYNIPHSNVQNTFFAGITSNNVRIQDFRIYPANSTNDILYTASNNLYYGLNPPSEYTITSNVVVKPVRWLESASYSSRTYDPYGRYITYNDTGDIGIGIGKSSVPDATLDIFTGDPSLYSIKTNNPIWVQSGVVASSDRRIKTNIRDFDANAALNQILSIQPKTYNYIDKHRTDDTIIGFSAQQIKEVIPNAVTLNTEAIPNIQSAAYLQDNCIYLIDTVDISEKISPMDTVVLEYNNSRYYERATEILNASSFKIENKSNIPNSSLFVYGTYVKDFHSLDKNYIYTLSVCATQDIHKKQEALYESINTFIDNLDMQSLDLLSSNIMKIKSQTSSNISYENLLEIRAKLSSIQGMDLSIQTSNLYIIDDILQNNSSILSKNQTIINNSDLYMTSTNNLDANIDKINDILQRNNLA